MKSIEISVDTWRKISKQLATEYPISVIAIREKMRRVLGFTTREHSRFNIDTGYQHVVYLDFYNENKRTMFLLKFGEYLHGVMQHED